MVPKVLFLKIYEVSVRRVLCHNRGGSLLQTQFSGGGEAGAWALSQCDRGTCAVSVHVHVSECAPVQGRSRDPRDRSALEPDFTGPVRGPPGQGRETVNWGAVQPGRKRLKHNLWGRQSLNLQINFLLTRFPKIHFPGGKIQGKVLPARPSEVGGVSPCPRPHHTKLAKSSTPTPVPHLDHCCSGLQTVSMLLCLFLGESPLVSDRGVPCGDWSVSC